MNTFLILLTLVLLFPAATALHAQVPQLINYQGRVAVNGVNFDGSGQFRFAIVNAAGTTSYWSNDGTSTAGSEPAAAVTLFASNGNYSVLLGDTTLPNMTAIPAGVFNNSDLLLRVWFNDGTNGSQLLTPDQPLQMDNTSTIADAWMERAAGAPPGRSRHTAVWTGSEIIIWGGSNGTSYFNIGGRYNPTGNSWTTLTTTGAPAPRSFHTAVWTGSEMIVSGGRVSLSSNFNDTFSYIPYVEDFRITNAGLSNGNLALNFPTVTGRIYTFWRCDNPSSGPWINTGLQALTGTGSTLTFTIPPPADDIPNRFFRVRSDP